MDRLVCPFTTTLCHDTNGVGKHIEIQKRLDPGAKTQRVYRCPNAWSHPERPYHFGWYRNARRYGTRAA